MPPQTNQPKSSQPSQKTKNPANCATQTTKRIISPSRDSQGANMYGASTGKQINNELEQDAKAWGEALAMAIPLGIGALAYQLNHWAGYIAGIIAYLIEFYLIKVHQMERWDIWTVWLTSIYARDLRPGQFFTAPGLPARCKVLQILDDDGAQLILYHSPEVVGGVYDIPLRYRVQLLE